MKLYNELEIRRSVPFYLKGIFLLVAFLSIFLLLACDDDNGNNFIDASCIPFKTGMGRGSSIALDSLSRPHISYADDDNLSIKYAYWDGENWVKETAYEHVKPENFDKFHLSENLGIKTYLHLGQNDKQLIHFCDREEDKQKYLEKNGSWLVQTIEQPTGCSASIDADSQGNPRMAYANEDSDELVYSILSPTPATTVVKGLLPDANYPFLNLFIDPEDDAHIGIVEVQTDGNGDEKTFYRIFQNGVTWQEESSSIQYDLISLALDSNDVFKGLFFNRDSLSYYYGEFLAGDWSFENITIPQGTVSGYFSLDDLELASDDQSWFYGNVQIFHFREEEGYSEYLHDIFIVHKDDGEWQSNILEVKSWGKEAEPSMSIDSSGNLHLSYCSKTFIRHSELDCEARAILYYATWDGNDWDIEKVDE